MCDYSLHHVASRPAKVGDMLVTTKFRDSITRGFSAIGAPHVAVCLLPGTEVAFEKDIEYDHFLAFFQNRKVGATVARFRQVDQGKQHVHHDALEFPNGKVVLLTQLSEGQRAKVLQLPAAPHATIEMVERQGNFVMAAETDSTHAAEAAQPTPAGSGVV
jgi:hypothetical protein